MGKILLLSEDVINKIAAGEVVERPKNVIKELVENSIDAKSTKIVITIKNGGKDYISILDNGTGILKDDLTNAFLPHATSKIVTDKDLYSVSSLGFRGEALSSISAVSRVSLTTKTETDIVGTRIVVEGSKIVDESEVSFNSGTLIEVSEIFANVPARLKFLKKATTESSIITEFVQKIAFCYPDISFKFVNNGTTILETSGNGNLEEVFYRIYGRDVKEDLIEVDFKSENLSISGLICKGKTYRANRNYESFFINKRIIKSNVLRKAVEDAYKGRLPIGKFPIFSLSIELNPSEIDINVHPSKEEVRFTDDDFMYDVLFEQISKALNQEINIPTASVVSYKKEDEKVLPNATQIEEVIELKSDYIPKDKFNLRSSKNFDESKSYIEIKDINIDNLVETIEIKKDEPIIKEVVEVLKPKIGLYENMFFKNVSIKGQLFDTYWVIEADNTSYIIDQHAAHEKILYEEFMYEYKNKEVNTQMLLMPISLILSEEESRVLDENIELFEKFGFEIEEFGKNTYALRSVPFVFDTLNTPSFFMDILENIRSLGKNFDSVAEIYEEKIISMSCKAAVKANDKLSFSDAKTIIEKLTKLNNHFNCPHGRPTIVELKKSEIEKMFKRVL